MIDEVVVNGNIDRMDFFALAGFGGQTLVHEFGIACRVAPGLGEADNLCPFGLCAFQISGLFVYFVEIDRYPAGCGMAVGSPPAYLMCLVDAVCYVVIRRIDGHGHPFGRIPSRVVGITCGGVEIPAAQAVVVHSRKNERFSVRAEEGIGFPSVQRNVQRMPLFPVMPVDEVRFVNGVSLGPELVVAQCRDETYFAV